MRIKVIKPNWVDYNDWDLLLCSIVEITPTLFVGPTGILVGSK